MIGLGTYAFFWQHSDLAPAPLSLIEAFEATRELGVDLFQICDYAPLESMDAVELADAAAAARDLDLTIELGTKGIEPEHLTRFLELAAIFDARPRAVACSTVPTTRPSLAEAEEWLTRRAAGVRGSRSHARPRDVRAGRHRPTSSRSSSGSDPTGSASASTPANVVARLEPPRDGGRGRRARRRRTST